MCFLLFFYLLIKILLRHLIEHRFVVEWLLKFAFPDEWLYDQLDCSVKKEILILLFNGKKVVEIDEICS